MRASDLLVRCLEAEGVKFIFGVPGEENADVMISLLDSSIKFVVCRHEQGAAFIADAYGRLTGRAGVCLGTLGPGATNLLTGVADANMDHAPLVVLTGQAATIRLHKESHQAMDVVALFDPVVKWGVTIQHADSIPEIVRKAFKIAGTEKMGATHIELPEDIAKHRSLKQPIRPIDIQQSDPDSALIEQAAALIEKADFPVILAGNGVLRNAASEALTALVDQTNIPVLNTFMGKGSLAASHPQSLFTIGLQARDYAVQALEEADLVLAVGYDLVEYDPKLWNRGTDKKIIHLDSCLAEVDDAYVPDIDVVADVPKALCELASRLPNSEMVKPERYAKYRQRMLTDFSLHAESEEFPLKPQKILWDVRQALESQDIVLSDVGAHKMWIARYFQCDSPNTCLISNGFCSMGFALPGAIGAKIACPDSNVMAICGDGGFMMNVQELETAVRLKLPMTILIWTDSQYGLIRWKQEAHFGKYSHIDFDNPDFVKLAESFGALGLRVEKAGDLQKMLKRALEADGPVVIDCPVDYSENMKLSKQLGEIPSTERSSILKKVPLFRGVNAEYLELLGDYMEERDFAPDTVLCCKGEPGDEVYVIVRGTVEVHTDENDSPHPAGVGTCIGEMSILADQPRSATVVVGKDGMQALVLSATIFQEVLRNQPEIGLELLRILSVRLSETI